MISLLMLVSVIAVSAYGMVYIRRAIRILDETRDPGWVEVDRLRALITEWANASDKWVYGLHRFSDPEWAEVNHAADALRAEVGR